MLFVTVVLGALIPTLVPIAMLPTGGAIPPMPIIDDPMVFIIGCPI